MARGCACVCGPYLLHAVGDAGLIGGEHDGGLLELLEGGRHHLASVGVDGHGVRLEREGVLGVGRGVEMPVELHGRVDDEVLS